VDDHVAMQVVGQVELLPAARMGAHLGPPFPVNQVDVILQGGGRGDPGGRFVSKISQPNKNRQAAWEKSDWRDVSPGSC